MAAYKLKPLADHIRWLLIRTRLRRFSLVVVDEAHHLKNPDSKQYAALESVFHRCFRDMLFLTATPFQLGPDELQSMLRLFRHSTEHSARSMDREAETVTACAQRYQDLVRTFEDAWQTLTPTDKSVVSKKELRGINVNPAFKHAFETLCQGHRDLQAILGKWVVRNVKERAYRETIQTPIPISSKERVPFAVLHRLLYEYQRQKPTFSAVQSLSLTSSWEAFRESAVMRGRAGGAGSVAFYRGLMRKLLSRNGSQHPKLLALSQSVSDEFRKGEKVLIFTARLESVKALQATLNLALEKQVYAGLLPLSRAEVDHLLRNLRKRVTTERDTLRLLFKENYCAYLRARPSANDIYPEVIRELARFGNGYRVGLKGKAHGPDWDSLASLCECIVFGRQVQTGSSATIASLHQFWKKEVVHPVDLKRRIVRILTPDHERAILRSHYCTKEQLVAWLDRVLKHRSVWEPYRAQLEGIQDLVLREELLDAVGRALFVPEILGSATLSLGGRGGVRAERALLAAAQGPRVQRMVRRFLEEIITLPAEEIRSFARGLRTENMVARASGDESIANRRRYRYGFNTPFRPYVLVASEVMQEGIDLHRECARVVHYDLAWNPARLEQRVGRVDRLGSKVERELVRDPNACLKIYRRYLPGTIDERMHLRVGDRERWFKFILGHRPEWEDDGSGDAGGVLLPDAFGQRLKIVLSPVP
ncbi:MAG: hypothetical protein A2V88_12225 [Elusimicrobia bacterium RBG_16_66_12]|nr:MAG: hypothetical protein A2V88_12225 [Elusimicrobia bacterium RBG_16_66_12]